MEQQQLGTELWLRHEKELYETRARDRMRLEGEEANRAKELSAARDELRAVEARERQTADDLRQQNERLIQDAERAIAEQRQRIVREAEEEAMQIARRSRRMERMNNAVV